MIMSKIIKHQSASYQKVELPEMTETGGRYTPLSLQNLTALQEQAYQEAYEHGHDVGTKQGIANGEAQMQQQQEAMRQRLEQIDQLMMMLNVPLQRLDQEVENELVTLVIVLLRQMFRREINVDPGQIVAVVRDAVTLLPINNREANLVLHPKDVDMVRNAFSEIDRTTAWHIVEDSTITPGGCRVVTRDSQVDATVENRLATLIAQVFGDDREHDGPS